jgi:hypothetical protein
VYLRASAAPQPHETRENYESQSSGTHVTANIDIDIPNSSFAMSSIQKDNFFSEEAPRELSPKAVTKLTVEENV